jgi:hypothetical protein
MLLSRLIFLLGLCLVSHAAQAYQADRILRMLPVVSLQETAAGVVVQYVAG